MSSWPASTVYNFTLIETLSYNPDRYSVCRGWLPFHVDPEPARSPDLAPRLDRPLLLERLGLEPARETTAAPRLTARTIRYYLAQGLMSRPEGQTRRAVYRYRHLLELLWIKAAQARGQSLDEIRRELHSFKDTGARDAADLEAVLLQRLPDPAPQPLPGSADALDRAVSTRLRRQRGDREEAPGGDVPPAAALHAPTLPSPWDLHEKSFGRERRLEPPVMAERMAFLADPAPDVPSSPYARSRRPQSEASLQVQVDLGEGIRLLIPAGHPLAEEILDRGVTVADLRRWLAMPDSTGRDQDG